VLERIDPSGEQQIRCEFPSGEHEGELYTVRLSFCQNPVCTCGTLDFTVVRDATIDTGTSKPEFHFCVDLYDEALDSSGREASEYDQNFGRAFVSHLDEQDWTLLEELFYLSKRRLTEEVLDEELDTRFPSSEIDRNGAMVAFKEILPYAEYRAIESDGISYLLVDQYCVLPKCGCSEIVVSMWEQSKLPNAAPSVYPIIFLDYETGTWRIEARGGKGDAFFEWLTEKLKSGDYPAWFRKRHSRLKSLYRMYTQRHAQPKPIPLTNKVGRNDPCPCGGGKKYKKCCLGK